MLTQERKGRKKAGKSDEEHLSAARCRSFSSCLDEMKLNGRI